MDGYTVFAAALGGLGLVLALVDRVFPANRPCDPREPPIVPSRIPWIGHIIGIIRHGARYYKMVCADSTQPIVTLPTLNSRTYVVSSPPLASLVQRASKTLSFNSLITEVTRRMVGFDEQTMAIVTHNMNNEDGTNTGLMLDVHHAMYSVLMENPELYKMGQSTLRESMKFANSVKKEGEDLDDLFAWTQRGLSLSAATAIYGPQNIFALDPTLYDDFWTFEGGLIGLLVDVFPSIFVRKANNARKRLINALIKYVEEGHYKDASKLIQNRYHAHIGNGFTEEAWARSELGMLMGALVNASVSVFWMVINVFSRPKLLVELRKELEPIVDVDGTKRTVNIHRLRSSCPLIIATFRESLRIYADIQSVRYVTDDTLLADKYFLRKDTVVQIAGGVIHADKGVWGPDATSFNPYHFIESSNQAQISGKDDSAKESTTDRKSRHPASFRAFGGGATLCPGRHFAQIEICGFVAVLILGFDVTPVGSESIKVPEKDDYKFPIGVSKPASPTKVRLQRRKGLEDVLWACDVSA
ncbi:cytochrome P450 [Lineolata rhizophorae]|uniref:Cytochrome P450 n=1 Tax=Lineolata rhizophorae TaxID=578093 RepID=A0A6A6NV21_9PEZI|nr:cytochrome P450 [Lineolata rhizophorae]